MEKGRLEAQRAGRQAIYKKIIIFPPNIVNNKHIPSLRERVS